MARPGSGCFGSVRSGYGDGASLVVIAVACPLSDDAKRTRVVRCAFEGLVPLPTAGLTARNGEPSERPPAVLALARGCFAFAGRPAADSQAAATSTAASRVSGRDGAVGRFP